MIDRSDLRNRIAITLASRPSLIPPLTDGSRTVVVVFLDEEVGPHVQQIANDYNGCAHLVVLNDAGEIQTGLSMSSTDDDSDDVNLLRSSITFGVLVDWVKSVHDGATALRFVFDDAPAVSIAKPGSVDGYTVDL